MLIFNLRTATLSRVDKLTTATNSTSYPTVRVNKYDDWPGKTIIARFVGGEDGDVYDVIVQNDTCTVPVEIMAQKEFFISFKGVSGSTIITTNQLKIKNAYSGFNLDAEEPATPTPDLITQLINSVAALRSMVGSPLVASTAAGMTDTSKIYVYTGSETGYTAGNWYYYDGSAWQSGGVYNSSAVSTDTSLSVSGAAADSKTVGDSIGDLTQLNTTDKTSLVGAINEAEGQIIDINDALDSITDFNESVNRFNPDTISLNYILNGSGELQSNSDAFSSDFIKCNPSSVVRYYRLLSTDAFQTNNMMYLCQYKGDKTFISRTTYASSGTALDANCHYIRFANPKTQLTDKIIAVVFDATLTKDTIAQFDDEYVLINQTQVDKNTSDISSFMTSLQTVNRLNLKTITEKTVVNSDGSLIANNDAFTSDYIECEPSSVIRYYRLLQDGTVQSNTILYLCQYDESKGFISRTTYANGAGQLTLNEHCHYVRLSQPLTQLADQVLAVTFNEAVTRATLSPYCGGLSIGNVKNVPAKLKVMTYNIGRYSYGVSPYYIDTDYNTKVANHKKFFAEQKCDVLGIEENNIFLDAVSNGSVTTNSLFNCLYPYFADEGNGASIKSKYPMYGQGMGSFTTSSRNYVYGTINVNGKEIYLMTVHLTPNAGETQDELRAQEVAEILDIVSNKEYFIVFGDFNAQTTAFYDSFTEEGYHLANGGYLPFEWTYSFTPEDFSADTPSGNVRYFDNIITSENIIVDYSERLNVYDDLSSDHIPFIAYLTII